MSYHHLPLVSETDLLSARRDLGAALPRILGYFRQDGYACVTGVEQAMHSANPTAMVAPAHRLKGESRQLGAGRLSALAEHLEMTARRCVEDRTALPDTLAEDVRALRGILQQSLAQLEQATDIDPPAARPHPVGARTLRPVFGRRAS